MRCVMCAWGERRIARRAPLHYPLLSVRAASAASLKRGGRWALGAWCVLLLLLLALGSARAAPPWPVGEEIRSFELQGAVGEAPADIADRLGVQVGAVFTEALGRAMLERAADPRRVRSLELLARPVEGGVHLDIVLRPRWVLAALEFEGDWPLSEGELVRALELEAGKPLDHVDLLRVAPVLERLLARRGWRMARVAPPRVLPDDEGQRVTLKLSVEAGARVRLGHARLKGRLPPELGGLERLGPGFRPGAVVDLDRLEDALERVLQQLRSLRYFDAVLAPIEVSSPRMSEGGDPVVDLVVPLDAGPATSIRIDGQRRVARSRLLEDAALLEELGTGEPALVEVVERMRARYERLGYPEAEVRYRILRRRDAPAQLVHFRIEEGRPTRVVRLSFPGAVALEEDRLRAQVLETLERFVAPATARTGFDPEVIDAAVRGGDISKPRHRPSTRPPDAETVYVPRAYRAAADVVADAYRSEGYLQVTVGAPKVELREPGLVEVSYPVDEGALWRVDAVGFSGHGALPAQALLAVVEEHLPLGERPPLTFDALEEARRRLVERYRDTGYAFVRVRDRLRAGRGLGDAPVEIACRRDQDGQRRSECAVEVQFDIETGPRVRVGRIEIRGHERTDLAVIRGQLGFREGEVLRQGELRTSRDDLVSLGIFARVDVHMRDEDVVADTKDVLVELVESDPWSMELGVGVSTEEGLRIFASFGDRNLFGNALRTRANAKVNLWAEPLLTLYEESLQQQILEFYRPFGLLEGEPLLLLEYELGVGLSYPRAHWLPRGLSLGLDFGAVQDYDPAFAEENQRLTLTGVYEGFRPWLFGRARPMRVRLQVDLDTAELLCNDAVEAREDLCSSGSTATAPGGRTEGRTLYLSFGLRSRLDLRDDPLDPKSGTYFEIEGQYAAGLDAESPHYVRVEGRMVGNASAGDRLRFQGTLGAARLLPLTGGVEIPLNRRLYAGGRSTIRGYPENTLLPRDVALDAFGLPRSDISSGGLFSYALKLEASILVVAPVSLAAFFDAGDLFRWGDATGECPIEGVNLLVSRCRLPDGELVTRPLAMGTGFGLRVATPIGPLAVDMAFPVARRDPAVDDWTLHFSVGAF